MEQVMQKEVTGFPVITPQILLDEWQAQRRLTRKVIDAFPEDKLLNYSIGGMRPFADMVMEFIGMGHFGIIGIVKGEWPRMDGTEANHGLPESARSKQEMLRLWDELTDHINREWPKISGPRFHDVELAFQMYEGTNYSTILYFIHNEIHHRGQAYVYLRSLGIEPPAFWDTK